MRARPGIALIFILFIGLLAGWLALPSSVLDVSGIKEDVDINQGLDLQGGVQLLLEADPPEGQSVSSEALEGVRDTIERRVNNLGVSEPVVQTRGDNQIVVELAGATDPEEATRIVQRTALLEIVDTNGQFLNPGTVITTTLGGPETVDADAGDSSAGASPEASPMGSPEASSVGSAEASPLASPAGSPITGATPVASPVAEVTEPPIDEQPENVYTTVVSGSDLSDAFLSQDQFGAVVVGFELKGDGADRFYDFTSANIGQPMAIVVDKVVISSPQINDAISSNGQITVGSAQEARDLVVQLKAGALNVPLTVVQSRTVGPTLGEDSIDRSLIAGIVGLGAVALFMIFYYRLPGVMSVLALLIYTAVTFSLFKLLNVTLTLAGIAGFILSIGMAVDANVLIFARMKEELRTGRSLAHSIEAGFDHAWPSIRDSNISSMITSAILFWFGRYTGASIITGFALTLFIGVLVSMFSAILVTRTFLRLLVSMGVARHDWLFAVVDEDTSPTTAAAD